MHINCCASVCVVMSVLAWVSVDMMYLALSGLLAIILFLWSAGSHILRGFCVCNRIAAGHAVHKRDASFLRFVLYYCVHPVRASLFALWRSQHVCSSLQCRVSQALWSHCCLCHEALLRAVFALFLLVLHLVPMLRGVPLRPILALPCSVLSYVFGHGQTIMVAFNWVMLTLLPVAVVSVTSFTQSTKESCFW